MGKPYVVQQGDHLVKIAYQHDVDAVKVWDDPENAELKKQRGTGDILHPGDVIQLPDAAPKGLRIDAGRTNSYLADPPKVDVVLVFHDGKQPLKDEPCDVAGLGGRAEDAKRTTGSDGKLALSVPVTTREVTITFPKRGMVFAVRVGDMDPHEEPSGIAKRLCNLGYLSIYEAEAEDDFEAMLAIALRAFQHDHGLPETGVDDEATHKAVVDKHML